MQVGQLLVVIIDTPNSIRSQPLISILSPDSRFDVVRLPACMLSTYADVKNQNIDVILETFQFLQGRLMSPQEIGCSTSHNRARYLLANSLHGGVILEDDARITNLDLFYNTCIAFLNDRNHSSSILSLTGFRKIILAKSPFSMSRFKNVVPLLGQPDLAVAYVLTSFAAKELYEANTPISTVSDWPLSKCDYFALLYPVVRHGDSSTSSVILMNEIEFRDKPNHLHKLKLMFSPIHISKIVSKLGLRNYFETIYLSRIFWKIDKFQFEIRKIMYRNYLK